MKIRSIAISAAFLVSSFVGAKPANAAYRLVELNGAILEVSCFWKRATGTVATASMWPTNDSEMMRASVTFENNAGDPPINSSRDIESGAEPIVATIYLNRPSEVTVYGSFSAMSADRSGILSYPFSRTTVGCTNL